MEAVNVDSFVTQTCKQRVELGLVEFVNRIEAGGTVLREILRREMKDHLSALSGVLGVVGSNLVW
jgi:hypothetical protein